MHLPDGQRVELPQAAQIAELVSMGRVKRRDTGEVVKLEGMPHDVGRFAFLRPFQFVVPIEPTGEPGVGAVPDVHGTDPGREGRITGCSANQAPGGVDARQLGRQLDATRVGGHVLDAGEAGPGSTPRPPPSTRPALVLSLAEYLTDSTSSSIRPSSQASTTGARASGRTRRPPRLAQQAREYQTGGVAPQSGFGAG